jgi:ATP-dependent protease ClpP protease subunit
MKVPIKGVIVSNDDKWIYDWLGIDTTCPNDVNQIIDSANKEDLDVDINSGGGDVYAGSEIYTALMSYREKQGKVVTNIVGIAASAAGIIAMAGNPVRISPTAQIMLHNVESMPIGDYRVLQYEAEIIKNYNISISNAYLLKTGLSQEKLLEMMNAGGSANYGTWLNAQQALSNKFADEIMFDTGNKLAASIGVSTILPPAMISKLKSHLKQQETSTPKPGETETKQDSTPEKDPANNRVFDLEKHIPKINQLTERRQKRNGQA